MISNANLLIFSFLLIQIHLRLLFLLQFKEMMIFSVLWFVIMLSYGVATTAMLSPQKEINSKTLKHLLLYPYLCALGNIDIEYNQKNCMLTNSAVSEYFSYSSLTRLLINKTISLLKIIRIFAKRPFFALLNTKKKANF